MRGAGYFNSSRKDQIYLSTRLKADKVDLNKLLFKLDNFGQDMLVSDNITGTARADAQGTLLMHPDLTPILSQSKANVALTIKNGELKNFAPMQALARFFQDKNLNRIRFDTLENTLALQELHADYSANDDKLLARIFSAFRRTRHERARLCDGLRRRKSRLVLCPNARSRCFSATARKTKIPAERLDSIYHQRDFSSQPLVPARVQGALKKYNISLSRK